MLRCKRKNHTRSSISTALGLDETIGMLGHRIHQCLMPLKAENRNVFKVKDCYSYKKRRGSTKPQAQQPGVPHFSGNF